MSNRKGPTNARSRTAMATANRAGAESYAKAVVNAVFRDGFSEGPRNRSERRKKAHRDRSK